MKVGAALLVAMLAVACSQSPQPAPQGDGVRVTGAVNGIYPVASAGTCLSFTFPSFRQLDFSGNPAAGQPGIGWVIGIFSGPGTYSDVRWPAEGHSSISLSVGSSRLWRAGSGTIVVTNLDASAASGTLKASGMKEVGGSTTVDAKGSWTCRMLAVPNEQPSASPSASPLPAISPSPPPIGEAVVRRVLAPATVLPAVNLCTSPVTQLQDGNAWPLFCLGGEINVAAWNYFVPLRPRLMSLGPNAQLDVILTAYCADIGQDHLTLPEEESVYSLAWQYYGSWPHGFDGAAFVTSGGCS